MDDFKTVEVTGTVHYWTGENWWPLKQGRTLFAGAQVRTAVQSSVSFANGVTIPESTTTTLEIEKPPKGSSPERL